MTTCENRQEAVEYMKQGQESGVVRRCALPEKDQGINIGNKESRHVSYRECERGRHTYAK